MTCQQEYRFYNHHHGHYKTIVYDDDNDYYDDDDDEDEDDSEHCVRILDDPSERITVPQSRIIPL